jgi:glycosyltransferase involved in cell wall biosynthesis
VGKLQVVNDKQKARILLVMRDPPEIEANKGGLFPTAIRHHVDLGFDVYVASIYRMTQRNIDVILSLGAKPAIPSTALPAFLERIDYLFRRKGKRALGPSLTSSRNISWIKKNIRPIVVTGLQSFPTGIIAQKLAQALDIKYLTWEHLSTYERGDGLPNSDEFFIKFFKNAHAVLVVSPSLGDAINQRFAISLSNLNVLPNPIPLNFKESPKTPKPDWLEGISDNDFVFASWTTWRDIKRLDRLLDSFGKVYKQNENVKLIVAGLLDEKSLKIKEDFLHANPSIKKSVLFTGSIDRASIRHLAGSADCCVISSDFETFGLQMVEAISVGTPVVSTRCGGPENILINPCLGQLCDKGSGDALSAAMLQVMSNRERFKRDEISYIADELFGDTAIKRKWAAVYTDIVPEVGSEL